MKKMGYFQRQKLSIQQLVSYESEIRKEEYYSGKKMKFIKLRKLLNCVSRMILFADMKASKEKIEIIADRHYNVKKPMIYACTHNGGNDVQRSFQAIRKHAYLMIGNPGILYKMPIYYALLFNGAIPFETMDKEERKIAYLRALELLEKGGSLLIFPEGAWNVTANLPVMKLFNGTVRMSVETGVKVVPVAMEQIKNTFYFNIGKNIDFNAVRNKYTEDEMTTFLRDILATLKWEIWEKQPLTKRKSIPNDYLPLFQNEIVQRCNYGYGYSLKDALSDRFYDKNSITEDEVFFFMNTIKPKKENAFLYRR